MRSSLETAMLEVVNTDAQGISELVVTTLTNDFMPLIRYRIGDLVERHEQPYCTRYIVHGRAKDAFVMADGRRVTTWQMDQCLADLQGIAHYQLSERKGGEWLLRFIPDRTPPTAADLAELQRRVEQLLEVSGKLTVEQADLLAPESSGKFRLGYPLK
jgi:phenylacetate-CoA ligase